MEKILIVDDEPELLESCQRILNKLPIEVLSAGGSAEALEILAKEKPGIVLSDLRMPGLDGMEMTKRVLELASDTLVIIMTGFGTVELAVEALKQGAFDFIQKPFSADLLRVAVNRALTQRELRCQNNILRTKLEQVNSFGQITGKSSEMQRIFSMASKVAATEAGILILGESGTGKEVLARAIHYNSLRSTKPFVPIDCASLPENLLENELFGHEKGAFTGAISNKIGLLECANGGTVFLDEVGELPLNLQVKLLRVLQERKFRRVGGNQEISVDIRVLAATNRDLWKLVQDKSFREDLYYRLNVIGIELPPLRERTGDVTLLARTFIGEIGKTKGIRGISADAERVLEKYSWPGNIRELRNAIERAVVLAEEELLRVEDFPEYLSRTSVNYDACQNDTHQQSNCNYANLSFNAAKEKIIADFEREYLETLLKRSDYHLTNAALQAGINRKTLYRLMEKHCLN